MFEPQRAFDVTWLFSSKKETTFGTALADPDLTHRVTANAVEAAKLAKLFRSDLDRLGKGHEFATELDELARDLRRSTSFDASSLTAAWVCAFGMGKVATTQPNPGGNPTAFQHVFTFADPAVSKHAPTTTVYEEFTADLQRRLVSLACNDFSLSGGARDPVQLTANWIGAGSTSDGALTPLPALAAQAFLFGRDADVLFGPQGAPVSIKDRVLDWSLSVTQNLDMRYHPGSGEFAGLVFHGLRQPSVSLRLFAKEADDILTLFKGSASKELQFTVEGAVIGAAVKHKLEIRLPAVRITALDDALEGNNYVWTLTIGPEGIFKGATLTEPLQITVVNEDDLLLIAA